MVSLQARMPISEKEVRNVDPAYLVISTGHVLILRLTSSSHGMMPSLKKGS